MEEGKKCLSLSSLFSSNEATPATAKISVPEKESTQIITESGQNQPSTSSLGLHISEGKVDNTTELMVQQDEILEAEAGLETEEHYLFNRPKCDELDNFFKYHPKKPDEDSAMYLKIYKAFKRPDNSERLWLTYCKEKNALFCTVCLAFSASNETGQFIEGMSDWKHIHQRIDEHEKTQNHGKNVESFFMRSRGKSIDKLLWCEQINLRNKQVCRNRQVVDRVINVIKLIGKRGLAFRGSENEAAYTLDDETLDHGNFLEIVLLLGKYDVILKDHLTKVIQESKQMNEKGVKQRAGNFLTFLSKTTVNSLIGIIGTYMKKLICDEIKEAGIFSLEIDTTQDVSTRDQCSIIARY